MANKQGKPSRLAELEQNIFTQHMLTLVLADKLIEQGLFKDSNELIDLMNQKIEKLYGEENDPPIS